MSTEPSTAPTNDQRSVTDQLRAAYALLNEHGLYDAADHCRRAVEDTERRMRTPEWIRAEAARRAVEARERAEKYRRAYFAASELHVSTNEDGRGFVFADDLLLALEGPGTVKETK